MAQVLGTGGRRGTCQGATVGHDGESRGEGLRGFGWAGSLAVPPTEVVRAVA